MTLDAFLVLRGWLCSQPLKLLDQADAWERVLAVLHWFVAHPQPGIYLRELDIAGVDSKSSNHGRACSRSYLTR